MPDPWTLSIQLLQLGLQLGGNMKNWRDLLSRNEPLSSTDLDALRDSIADARLEQIAQAVLLSDLIVAFSKEHSMPAEVVSYARLRQDSARTELQELASEIKLRKIHRTKPNP